MDTFEVGETYAFAQIQAQFGGDCMSYLPQVGTRVVCGRFTPAMNPNAPYEILVGDPPKVQRKAELLATQRGMLPVFLKDAPKAWRYCGMLEFVDYITDARAVERKAHAAGRTDRVVGMLVFQDPT
jgi:hypothetical protein